MVSWALELYVCIINSIDFLFVGVIENAFIYEMTETSDLNNIKEMKDLFKQVRSKVREISCSSGSI